MIENNLLAKLIEKQFIARKTKMAKRITRCIEILCIISINNNYAIFLMKQALMLPIGTIDTPYTLYINM